MSVARALAVLMGLSGLALLAVFASWQGRLAAIWLLLAAAALWTRRRALLLPLGLGLLVLLGQAPPGPFWLRFSPLNLIPEPDLVRLGLTLFYPGERARIEALALPLYREPPEATAVTCTALDVLGLGTGSGHAYLSPAPGRPLLLFLHGALGNFQSYRAYWKLYHPGAFTVVCPTNGFGDWSQEGALETALAAVDRAGALPGATVLAGMSNGAVGALRTVAARPQEFAALVLISPVLRPDLLANPTFLAWGRGHPILVLEGDRDINVPPASVERGVEQMRGAGLRVDYRLLEGHDHFLMFSARAELFAALDELGL